MLLRLGALPIIGARIELIHRDGTESPCHNNGRATPVDSRETGGDLDGLALTIEIRDVGRQPPARPIGSRRARG